MIKLVKKIKAGNIDIILLVGLIYFMLAVGTFTAYEYIPNYYGIFFIITVSVYLYILKRNFRYIKSEDLFSIIKCLIPLIVVYLLMGLNAINFLLYIKKIEGAFVATIAVSVITVATIRRFGLENFLSYIVMTIIAILFVTLIYKVLFGFWDRGVRFFLNGPIVFSWFMGLGILISLYLNSIKELDPRNTYILTFIFSSAMAWTESKGPLVVLLLVLTKILCDEFRVFDYLKKINFHQENKTHDENIHGCVKFSIEKINRRKVTATVMAFIVISFVMVSAFTPSGIMSRFMNVIPTIGSINNGEINIGNASGGVNYGVINFDNTSGGVNYGSIGIRVDMWKSAWELFLENPFIGVGPTNWGLHSGMIDLLYPHNILLEVASELGMMGIFALSFVLLYVWIKTTNLGRIIIFYFFMASMLSGDISYLRLILALPIAFIVLDNRRDANSIRC